MYTGHRPGPGGVMGVTMAIETVADPRTAARLPSSLAHLFGRRASPDPRDLRYLLADLWPEPFAAPRAAGGACSYRGPVYDQDGAPTDVACALLSALHASPHRVGPSRCPSVGLLDRRIREAEGAIDDELTLRAGCRELGRLGLIRSYAWSYDPDEVAAWLAAGRGGLVLGLDWYPGMSRPDRSGLIRVLGRPLGGHAVFAWGIERPSNLVLIQNSWGEGWGGWSTRKGRRDFKGCAKLPLEDLARLLHDNGEAVMLEKNTDWAPHQRATR